MEPLAIGKKKENILEATSKKSFNLEYLGD
jgi:hypothetical protein